VRNDVVVDMSVAEAQLQSLTQTRVDEPLLFTSSGLGDAVVDRPRRALFREWFTPSTDWRERQDSFHRHSWPDRTQLSVCIRRADARTVSCTVIELLSASARLTYYPQAPDEPGPSFLLTIGTQAPG
jgi:hypothetical protein